MEIVNVCERLARKTQTVSDVSVRERHTERQGERNKDTDRRQTEKETTRKKKRESVCT